MSIEKKKELLELVNILEERKKKYKLLSTQLQEHQSQVLPYVKEKIELEGRLVPEKKYILYQGGNGSGKTYTLMYIVALLAL
jgi:signal recognition particle GTPase